MSSRRPTSKDVAKLAGVSRTTVSFVLNNSKGHSISEETAKRVRAAADKLGYMPFSTTRVLRKLRSNTILVLSTEALTCEFPSEYYILLSQLLAKHQVSCLFAYAPTERSQLLSLCETADPDAILLLNELTAENLENLKTLGVPILSLPKEISVHGSDAGVIAATHLFQRGSHKILFPTWQTSPTNPLAQECLRGIHLVANAQTQTNDTHHRVETIYLEPTTSALLQMLQSQLETISAGQILGVCTHSTQIGMSILRAAANLQLDIPARLKLVVVAEDHRTELTLPALTTVSVNLRGQIHQIARQLLTAVGLRAKNINIEENLPSLPVLTHRESS